MTEKIRPVMWILPTPGRPNATIESAFTTRSANIAAKRHNIPLYTADDVRELLRRERESVVQVYDDLTKRMRDPVSVHLVIGAGLYVRRALPDTEVE